MVYITFSSLYNFLNYCLKSPLEKNILDCGAGGKNPPLFLFHQYGFKTTGIEIDELQIKKTNEFEEKHNVDLNIKYGDMTSIDFFADNFSFIYTYNTTVHMPKKLLKNAISEIHRVLKPDGLLFINFLSYDSVTSSNGQELEEGEIIQEEDDENILYVHYHEDEILKLLTEFKIIYKEKKVITRIFDNIPSQSGYYEFILQK